MRSRFIMYGVRIKIKNEHSYLLYTEEIEKTDCFFKKNYVILYLKKVVIGQKG